VTKIDITEFITVRASALVIDVRSPLEFAHAHIQGAHSLPIFSDDERATIGTAYKKQSREIAIKIGLDAFGPKLRAIVEQAEKWYRQNPERAVIVHCWRGGMRSAAMQWLLNLYGIPAQQLVGGYKAYRKWCINILEMPQPYAIVGGKTGSGKTHILAEMQAQGAHVLCLETIGIHRGSAYGGIGLAQQPSQEMWENAIAERINELNIAKAETIYVEDESQRLGLVFIPHVMWQYLRAAPLLYLDLPFEDRLNNICADYAHLPIEELQNATTRIAKRLGFDLAKQVNEFIAAGELKQGFSLLLKYYDKVYTEATQKRPYLTTVLNTLPFDRYDVVAIAKQIISYTFVRHEHQD
jgi:tRNA 2-selenouridine synthase